MRDRELHKENVKFLAIGSALIVGVAALFWLLECEGSEFDPRHVDGITCCPACTERFQALEERVAALEEALAKRGPTVAQPVVVIHGTNACPPCDRWQAIEQPKLEALGWRVLKAKHSRRVGGNYPWFEVYTAGGRVTESGYQTTQQLRDLAEGIAGK